MHKLAMNIHPHHWASTVEAHAQYGVHFYDGMVLAAAERGVCARMLSEDFNAGQSYFGIKVENPFA